MKSYIRVIVCALCLVFCMSFLAGCGGNEAEASATPAPSGSQTAVSTPKTDTYLMDRDENLKNAIKQGEIYRYFEWIINDTEDPFAASTVEDREFFMNRRNAVEQKYGITIQYVAVTSNWVQDFAAAAYAGAYY